MITLQDEVDGRERAVTAWVILIGVAAVIAITLGIVKVNNELNMTKEYARWADETARGAAALERIADAVEAFKVTKQSKRYEIRNPYSVETGVKTVETCGVQR